MNVGPHPHANCLHINTIEPLGFLSTVPILECMGHHAQRARLAQSVERQVPSPGGRGFEPHGGCTSLPS